METAHQAHISPETAYQQWKKHLFWPKVMGQRTKVSESLQNLHEDEGNQNENTANPAN